MGMQRMFKSRSWRKFSRSRLALVATGVIGVYLLVTFFSFAGGITRDDTQIRVLPDKTRGWLEAPGLERRLRDAEWYLDRLGGRIRSASERAGEAGFDPQVILSEVRLAERTVADLPLDELLSLLGDAESKLNIAYDAVDAKDVVLDEKLELQIRLQTEERRSPPDASAIERLKAQISEIDATSLAEAEGELDQKLLAVEEVILQMQPMPEGFAGFWYGVRTFLGSDGQGRSIAMKGLYSTRIAFQIGLVVAIVSVLVGTLLGAAAGFYGGWVDYAVMYVVSVLSSIPTLVLLGVLVYMFFGHPVFDNPAERPGMALVPVYCAMCLTFWISTCRVIRGEVMKIKELEFVQAATSIGFGRPYILIRHVIPNTAHLMFINLSLLFIGAIKSEVILSFLGLGVKGQASWGTMISQAKEDVTTYFFWEVGTASLFMFVLVLAFNILSDALQDAFDPKHVD